MNKRLQFLMLLNNLIINNLSINSFMNEVFYIVAGVLNYFSDLTGLTYEEVNIIVYFFVIPFTWFVLIDIIFKRHIGKFLFLYLSLFSLSFLITNNLFTSFSFWLFSESVKFLSSFTFLGLDYTIMSVIVCVFLVILVYALLVFIILVKRKKFIFN